MPEYISDPIIYPVVFSIDRRKLTLIDNKYATVTFCISGENSLYQGFYFNDGNFITDIDLSSEKTSVFIKDRKKSVFEFMASSTDINFSEFSVKIWKDGSSFSSFNSGSYINVRQSPWYEAVTPAMFYCNNSMKQFSPVFVSEIPYYPSVSVTCSFDDKYNSDYLVSAFSLSPGESITKNMIDADNWGILSVLVELSVSWYYDAARTLLVGSPPGTLEFENKYFSIRNFFVSPGKFSYGASSGGNGLCIVDGVFTKDYILSISGSYGSFHYSGENAVGRQYFSSESEVIIDDNGYCAKEGQISQIYFLESGYSSSSSSSASPP